MNYIKEMNAFIDWLETNPLETSTQTLWFHLMAIANKSGWPEWFAVTNPLLMAKVGISENSLVTHRNKLEQKGRIEYRSQGRKKPGKYRVIPFSTSNIEVTEGVMTGVMPEVMEGAIPSALSNKTKLKKTKQKQKDSEPPIPETPQESKTIYAEKVTLSADQYEKVILKYGSEDSAKWAIERLSNYKCSKGAMYKSDYHVLIGWVFDDFEKKKLTVVPGGQPPKQTTTSRLQDLFRQAEEAERREANGGY